MLNTYTITLNTVATVYNIFSSTWQLIATWKQLLGLYHRTFYGLSWCNLFNLAIIVKPVRLLVTAAIQSRTQLQLPQWTWLLTILVNVIFFFVIGNWKYLIHNNPEKALPVWKAWKLGQTALNQFSFPS